MARCRYKFILVLTAWISSYCIFPAAGQVLTPPYFNLAEGRRITATATCGEGVDEPELFCKLVGANSEDRPSHFNVIQGQLCDYCDPNDPQNTHPPEHAIDGSERWWQSPPLSRGMNYNAVNISIDLGQLFQVAYVVIKMANSPRPGIWVLERSVDNGKSYTPWQFFADSDGDCEKYFGQGTLKPIYADDDVVCTTRFSKVVPLEGGEIFVSLLNDRPSAKNFFNSSVLQTFTRATNVRLRLLRTKTLLGHLMSVARQDPTVTRRYFYSIKDISIGGRCVCNGHASVCDITDPEDKYQLQCRCQHHTCGTQCENCCPGFIQKKWRPASYSENFVCESCNCFGHSNECTYDEKVDNERGSLDIYGSYEGGGVCQNCRHYTRGINCNKCVDGYFRPYGRELNDTDVCQPCRCRGRFYTGNCFIGSGQCECKIEFLPPNCDACNDGYYDYPNCKPCDCHKDGTIGGICEVGGGQCPCKENYMTLNCDQCAPGFFNFPKCEFCNCHSQGSLTHVCDVSSGQCKCQHNYGGQYCARCEHGYFDFSNNCTFCNCDARGTVEEICDKETSECLCKEGFSGRRCDNNAPGFWGYPLVQTCGCHEKGSSSAFCDASGQCACLSGYAGRACNQCSPGYYNFPECQSCNCDHAGSNGISCDSEGRCQCRYNFDGIHCDKCRDGFYNFPLCEECNCNPSGVLETFAGCGNAPVGELCECKERVAGRICNLCRPLFWNLQPNNPHGCEECSCHTPGTIGALTTCNMASGQCVCKPHVTSRRCDQCQDGTFNLMEDNLFGCSDCHCNIGGSINNKCDKVSGQCQCRYRIQGQRCDQPMQTHYFPTLYQQKYEAENGRTVQNTPVRFGYDENVFPGYSWRGYAVYSELQKETLHDVYISKPSLYRLIFYYMNPSLQTLKGKVTITPENPLDDKQEVEVTFPPTSGPSLLTVSTPNGFPLPFVLNPGIWTLSFQNSHQHFFLDYLVLLPSAYYEATILTEAVTTPCHAGNMEEACLHYEYPNVNKYDLIHGSAGYVDYNGTRESVELYEESEVLDDLNSHPMPWLGANQKEIQFDLRLRKSGPHVILLNYFTPNGAKATGVQVTSNTQNGIQKGRAVFYDCTFSWPCRQIVSNLQGEVAIFDFDSNYVNIIVSMQSENGADTALHSVVLIPEKEWQMNFVTLKPVCTRVGGECLPSSYPYPRESTKIEFEHNLERKSSYFTPPGVANDTILVYLNKSDPMVDITGKLRSAGRYIFVIHYYQPSHPDFQMDILLQNGQFYEGLLPISHCPSTSGCRAILTHLDGYNVFDILENFVLTLKLSPDRDVWLDYLMVVPEENYSPEILKELPRDKTKEFFEKCGKNNFNIHPSESGFCRESAFALTADYNNGALPCQCNFQGASSFECEVFGGQCHCRINVIGRECDQCKTGYFGFPNCRPCDCPSTALCDPLNGECICPPRVVGDRCERCALYTYGFDPIIGCEECRCTEIGVLNRELQCNLNTGQCLCKDNVVGRRCERCAAGYWSFPFCQLCNCDLRGTEEDICSQSDATCFCKENTEGHSCDQCVRGTYHLEESNPDGCTPCFCFGKSDFCSSSTFVWTEIPYTNGWKATYLKFSDMGVYPVRLSEKPIEYPSLILVNLTEHKNPEGLGFIYYSVPKEYLGKRIASYGGSVTFKLLTVSSDPEMTQSGEADLVLTGNNVTAIYFYDFQIENGRTQNVHIQLLERSFKTLAGVPMKRAHFMMLLKDLDGIFIRAQYHSASKEARLSEFVMETATPEFLRDAASALSVEQCQCPPNYAGPSCEDCAPGYYRADTGPYGGFCVPCQCHKHADICDTITGKCLECRDDTMGDHCELCVGGYFGNARRGTPYDCLICSCPLPSITNNFATSCELQDDDEIFCECQAGYAGVRCDICAPGSYGQPTLLGDYCKPCECNNNIDPTSPIACDDISGLCLTCLNNTYGTHCERCSPGYHGDAILLKNCERCTCDECGTRECQHFTGVCECHPNVIGDNCDRCAPDFWGFASCQGCHSCNCAEASESSQCDEQTGQCICNPGVTGQRCDRCKPGYWKYTEFGCTECACRSGFSVGVGCDPLTGQCSCLPGVIGDNCEGCPERWVLVEGRGCQECDDCVHDLLDSTDELHTMILPVIEEYASAAQSFFLHQRLQVINASVGELRPKVNRLDTSEEDLRPVKETLDKLYSEAIAVSAKSKLLDGRASASASDGSGVRNEAKDVLDRIREGHELSRNVINEINFLVIGLEKGRGAQIEITIREAEAILDKMKKINFTSNYDKVRVDLEIADEFLDRIKSLTQPGAINKELVDSSVARLVDLQKKINEMQKLISESREKSRLVQSKNHKSRIYGLANVEKKHAEITRLGDATEQQIDDADNFTTLARTKLEEAEQHYFVMDNQLSSLLEAKNNLNESVIQNIEDHESAIEPAENAIDHSYELQERAENLDNLLTDTRQATENALRAAHANENIVIAIEDAYQAAIAARNASDQAVSLSTGVSEEAVEALASSSDKYSAAESKTTQVEDDLLPKLNKAQVDVASIEAMNSFANKNLDAINGQLENMDGLSLETLARKLQKKAVMVDEQAEKIDEQVEARHNNLQKYAEEARLLSQNIEAARRDTKLALEQVKNVEEVLPGMQETTRDLLTRKNNIQARLQDVGDRLERLRRTITKTREKTNKIKVGIDFEQGSVLELKNPDDLSDTATSTELSMFIKTADRSGLPLFLGTPVGGSNQLHRTSTDDFMAIEIDEGFVRLTTNLGAGSHSIVNSAYVADNKWHKIYIKRIGKVVQLAVHSENEKGNEEVETVEKVLPGTFSILNLDPKVSKLYVGGIPTGVEVDPSLINTYFTGQMEDLWLNKRPIGLWNFVSRGSTEYPLNGAKERLVLKKAKSTEHILRFDGTGYVSVETKGHGTSPELSIVLTFKTFAEDGLLFLLRNGPQEYVSLEMRGGKVIYQHNLQNRIATLSSDGIYNDDEWHTIEATRVDADAVMKIDSGDFQQKRSVSTGLDFTRVPEVMFFGGYPGEHSITDISNEDFRGCIKDVRISEVTVDFSRSRESIGTVPGCIVEEVSLVSFNRESLGYVKLASPEGSGLQLVFKFRTESPDGLLFYTETSDRSIYLSLSLAEGALVLRSAPGGEIATGSYTQYNDSEWHIVIATRENNELRLDIDDFEKFSVQLIQESVPFDGPVFFGGVPRYYSISAAAAASDINFYGCIGDATLNGRIIDFSAAPRKDRPGAMLETCSLSKEVTVQTFGGGSTETDIKYPIDASSHPRTHRPSVITEDDEDSSASPSDDDHTPLPFYTFPPQRPDKFVTGSTETPLNYCALPVTPDVDNEVTNENGLRFGSKRDSRIEYDDLPAVLRGDFVFSVDFKTFATEGIIFYAANLNHRDFVTIYMNDGKIVFSFNPGSNPAIIRSLQRYNDNTWHKLVAHRTGDLGRLEIDGYIVANGSTTGQAKHIEQQPPYYFGGLDNDMVESAKDNTEQTLLSFNGCLRGFRMNNKIVGGKRKVIAISECSYKVEPGVYFGDGKLAHAVVRLKFNVGLTFEMTLDIKPRKNSGVLMSVHGRKDFILLQLRDGVVELKIDNGKGIVSSQYNLTNPYQICDGAWHAIQVVKNKHVVVLIVDGVNTEPVSGPLGASSSDTNNPLFLGTQPRLSRRRGNAVEDKFVGCIRNVVINSEKIDLAYTLFVGEVNAGVCPLT